MYTHVCAKERKRDLGCMHEWFLDSLPFCWIILKALATCSKFAGTNWLDCDCFHFSDRRENCLVRLEVHLNPEDTYLINMYCNIQAQAWRRLPETCVPLLCPLARPCRSVHSLSYSISLWSFKNVKNLSSVLVISFLFVCFKWFVWLIISAPFFKKKKNHVVSSPWNIQILLFVYKQSYSLDGNNSHTKNAEKRREDPTIGETFKHLSKFESLNTICDKHIYVSIQFQQEIWFHHKNEI